MTIRAVAFGADGTLWDTETSVAEPVLAALGDRYVLGLVTNGNADHRSGPLATTFDFRLAADDIGIGIRTPDPRLFLMACLLYTSRCV